MKIFKKRKNISSKIKLLIIGGIIGSFFSVYATGNCIVSPSSHEVSYKDKNVEDALDYLYEKSSQKGNGVFNLYYWGEERIKINEIANSNNLKTDKEELINENPLAEKYYLKYNLEDNSLKRGYLCFNVSRELQREYPEMRYGEYCLQGGDNGDSIEKNITLLNKAFGNNMCNSIENGYKCEIDNIYLKTSNDGSLFYRDENGFCEINLYGYSYCSEDLLIYRNMQNVDTTWIHDQDISYFNRNEDYYVDFGSIKNYLIYENNSYFKYLIRNNMVLDTNLCFLITDNMKESYPELSEFFENRERESGGFCLNMIREENLNNLNILAENGVNCEETPDGLSCYLDNVKVSVLNDGTNMITNQYNDRGCYLYDDGSNECH